MSRPTHLRLIARDGRRTMSTADVRCAADAVLALHGPADALRVARAVVALVDGPSGQMAALRDAIDALVTAADHPDSGVVDSLDLAELADHARALLSRMTAR